MPELPEVETTVRGLSRYLDGARLARVEPRRAGLRRPFPADLVQVMTGARVAGMGRRADRHHRAPHRRAHARRARARPFGCAQDPG